MRTVRSTSMLYPAAMGEAIFTAHQPAFRSGSPGSPTVQHVNRADDDPRGRQRQSLQLLAKSQQRAARPRKVAAKPNKVAGRAKKAVAKGNGQLQQSLNVCGSSKACRP